MFHRVSAIALLTLWCANVVTGQAISSESALAEQEDDTRSSCCSPPSSPARRFVIAEGRITAHADTQAATKVVAPPGMLWIPGRKFVMGDDSPSALRNEKPAHSVRIDGFWMDATEVTNAEIPAFR